ncbi:MAG: hypothetical protein FD170_2086 [Bacteroidetes bacterium]|nr:MAG: hypothetical protein FD170_2086 [Bacteroidota bacterium]
MTYTTLKSIKVHRAFQTLLLISIPVILFLSSLDTIKEREKVWYGAGYDPEYAYLFNSLNVATFRLVGHFDHPGTPMQVFGALVLQGSWLINPDGDSLTQDVLSNPEEYLRLLNASTALLAAIAVFIAGIFILFRTGNLWYAIILQLIPFISGFILYNAFARITQEAMLMISSLALATALVDWLINSTPEKENRYAQAFGIIAGFGMASKILFAPLLIIPFFILSNFKRRKKYLLYTAASFVIFTLPVITLYPNMAWWVIKLFIFTGQYGSGPVGLVDTLSYPQNLWWTLMVNPKLAMLFGGGLLWITMLIIIMKSGKTLVQNKTFRLLAATVAALAFGYLIVAKQPKESYLLPYEMIASVLIILVIYQVGNFRFLQRVRAWIPALLTLAFAGFVIPSGLAAKKKIYSPDKNHLWETSRLAAESASQNSIQIFAHPASSPEAALFFGNAYSHWRYTGLLKNLYPDTYIFNIAENKIVDWDNSPVEPAALSNAGRILIQGPVEITQALQGSVSGTGIHLQEKSFYEDEKQIILIAYPEKDEYQHIKQSLIFSSSEKERGLEKQLQFSVNGFTTMGNIDFSRSRNGYSSLITDNENPYAFTTKNIMLQSGDKIEVNVYAYGTQSTLKIIVSESDTRKVLHQSLSPADSDKWSKHNLTFVNAADSTMNVFVYCLNHGSSLGWFDDFSLETTNSIRP